VDGRLADNLDRLAGTLICNISKQPLDDEGKRWGKPSVFKRCMLIGVTHPDVNAEGGGDTAMLELTFAAGGDIG
jgi:hypothetical protein